MTKPVESTSCLTSLYNAGASFCGTIKKYSPCCCYPDSTLESAKDEAPKQPCCLIRLFHWAVSCLPCGKSETEAKHRDSVAQTESKGCGTRLWEIASSIGSVVCSPFRAGYNYFFGHAQKREIIGKSGLEEKEETVL